MKKIKNTQKTNFFKKIFIKFCRLLGYEIIEQSNFRSTTLNKDLNETLSIPKFASFVIIWTAVVIFIIDMFKEEKTNENNTQLLG